ncbi:MAG: glycosyltransferase [Clostridiales bacterium]|nr:glycosyltransferase [Clostridiales bacterium]
MGETVQPVVSVIIPVYNVERYLAQCLDSVLSQTLENIEVICVDDGSTDSSRQTVIEYAKRDPRIVPILHEENLGTAQTRKDGVAASTGRYIMFVDGDDTIVPEACERAAKAIETYGTDIVQFNTLVVNCAGVSEARILSNQKALRPWLERIEEDNLIFACWEEKSLVLTYGIRFTGEIYAAGRFTRWRTAIIRRLRISMPFSPLPITPNPIWALRMFCITTTLASVSPAVTRFP